MLLGSENRSTRVSGVGKPKHRRALGSILGRFRGSERKSRGVRGGGVGGGRWRPKKIQTCPAFIQYRYNTIKVSIRYRYSIDKISILHRLCINAVLIQYRYCIDTVSIQCRYCIDTVPIQYRYCTDTVSIQYHVLTG